MTVAAIHPNPVRTFAYLDADQAGLFGLTGLTNQVQVLPATGVSQTQLRRALLGNEAITSVQSVTALSDGMRDLVRQFVDMLNMLAVFVVILTLLIAFNTASVSADERTREHATLYAFGLRTGTLLRNSMLESLLIGLLGTAFGLLAGWVATAWAVESLMATTIPDIGMSTALSFDTVLVALAVGVVAVVIAPLFTVRRLRRLNIPASLRVVE